ncbi:MAG: putative small secreted protein [Lentimonas sp.]|jgi:predicted small secreted protein
MKRIRTLILLLLLAAMAPALTSCGTTSTENGVTIEGSNPLKFW